MVIDSESTTKIEQNQEPIIGAAVKAQLEQTTATHMQQPEGFIVQGRKKVVQSSKKETSSVLSKAFMVLNRQYGTSNSTNSSSFLD